MILEELSERARNFIEAADVGGNLKNSPTNLAYINAVDLACTKAGITTGAVYPIVGGNATSHKFNLLDPRDSNDAYRLTFHNNISHTILGMSGTTALQSYVRTYYTTNLFNPNSHHALIKCSNYTSGSVLGGWFSGTAGHRLSLNVTSFSSMTNTTSNYSGSIKNDFSMLLNRNSSINSFVINNDRFVGVQTTTSVLVNNPLIEFRLFNRNTSEAADVYGNDPTLYLTATISFVSIGNGLNDNNAKIFAHDINVAQRSLLR